MTRCNFGYFVYINASVGPSVGASVNVNVGVNYTNANYANVSYTTSASFFYFAT
jgi:hypothetical protein